MFLYKFYNNTNLVLIAVITLLNYNNFNLQLLKLLLKIYVIIDCLLIVYFKQYNNQRKINQLILHHITTFILLVTVDYLPTVDQTIINKITRDNISLENSTLLILLSKTLHENKFPKIVVIPLKYFSTIVWIYYRIIFYPYLVQSLKKTYGIFINELIILTCFEIIKFLGIVWTLEALKVPTRYYRPLVVSTFACFTPILIKCKFQSTSCIIASYIFITSSLHHCYWDNKGLIKNIDQIGILAIVIYGTIKQYRNYLWYFILFLSCLLFSVARKINQNKCYRDWDNLLGLTPHLLVHVLMSYGVYYLIIV
jgi:hypothetical protein